MLGCYVLPQHAGPYVNGWVAAACRVRREAYLAQMNVQAAVREVIASVPGFFGTTRKRTVGVGIDEIVYTQDQIAQRVAAVLPDSLAAKGFTVVALPPVECDEPGRRWVRVPVTGQPWADGEVRIAPRGDRVAIVNVPADLLVQDVPGLAAALMSAHAAAMSRRGPGRP